MVYLYYVSKKIVILDAIILSKEVFFSLIVYELGLQKHYLSKCYCMKRFDKIEQNYFSYLLSWTTKDRKLHEFITSFGYSRIDSVV